MQPGPRNQEPREHSSKLSQERSEGESPRYLSGAGGWFSIWTCGLAVPPARKAWLESKKTTQGKEEPQASNISTFCKPPRSMWCLIHTFIHGLCLAFAVGHRLPVVIVHCVVIFRLTNAFCVNPRIAKEDLCRCSHH